MTPPFFFVFLFLFLFSFPVFTRNHRGKRTTAGKTIGKVAAPTGNTNAEAFFMLREQRREGPADRRSAGSSGFVGKAELAGLLPPSTTCLCASVPLA